MKRAVCFLIILFLCIVSCATLFQNRVDVLYPGVIVSVNPIGKTIVGQKMISNRGEEEIQMEYAIVNFEYLDWVKDLQKEIRYLRKKYNDYPGARIKQIPVDK